MIKKIRFIVIGLVIGLLIGLWFGINVGKNKPIWSNPFDKRSVQKQLKKGGGQLLEKGGQAIEKGGRVLQGKDS